MRTTRRGRKPPTIEEITAKHAATFRADARILDLKLQREALAKRIEEAAEKDSTSVTALPMQRALQALDDLILR